MHFGATLRLLRVDAGFSLRELAHRIGVSTAYLSRVENGHDPAPTPDRLADIAQVLDVTPHILLGLARQAGAAVTGYVKEVPTAGALFLDIARRRLGPADIARLRALVDREFPARRGPRRAVRLSELLELDRVVVNLLCTDIEDLVGVAVSRLPVGRDQRRGVAARILEREEEAASSVGAGVVIPHAVVPGVTTAAALVTLSRPMRQRGADGEPVELAFVLVTGEAGPAQLALLAQAARLAAGGVARELGALRGARRILDRLAALEASL